MISLQGKQIAYKWIGVTYIELNFYLNLFAALICFYGFRKDGFVMTMRSITKIKKGQEITHAYTEPLDPVMTRKSILNLGKFFQVI